MIAPRLGVECLLVGAVVCVGRIVALKWLTSQKGCARLVVSNFDEWVSRCQRLGQGDIRVVGEARWRPWSRRLDVRRAAVCLVSGSQG